MITKEDIRRYVMCSIDPSTTNPSDASDYTEIDSPDLAEADIEYLTSHKGSFEGVVDAEFMDELMPSVVEKGHFILFMRLALSCHWLTEQNLTTFMEMVIESPYTKPTTLETLFKLIPESMYPSVQDWLINHLRSPSPKGVTSNLFTQVGDTHANDMIAVLEHNLKFISQSNEDACRF